MNNPLLNPAPHVDYPRIKAEHIEPAISALLARARAELQAISQRDIALGWDAIVAPFDDALDALSRSWGVVGHLNAVMDQAEWRKAFNLMLPQVTDFYTALEQDQGLLDCFKRLRQSMSSDCGSTVDLQRQRSLELAIQDFRLSGAELPPEQRAELAVLIKSLSEHGQKFSENVLDAINEASCMVEEPSGLDGLPEDVIEAARQQAKEHGQEGWRFTPHMPSYLPVMQYAHDRKLREKMYRIYSTLASDQGDPTFDNGPLMEKILALRQASAKLLGFDNFVAMSLQPKMASSSSAVKSFLLDLHARVKPQAQQEITQLADFASRQLGIEKLEAWDIPYVSQQLKQRLFDFSDQEVKAYFQLDKVLDGLFQLIQKLFAYRFELVDLPVWHKDVRCYAIYGNTDETARAYVYLDLYSRPGKRSGAWMNVAANRRRIGHSIAAPMAWLTCNFQAPVGSRPATLTHDEVTTLFHEFGHGLHHVLTDMHEPRVSGLNGVEWDAVELPSQFLENFAWEWDQIQQMTEHVESGASLPAPLYQRMLKAKHFMMGMYLIRQLEFGLFDLALHERLAPAKPNEIMALLNDVRRQVAVVPYPEWNRFPHAFSHIFAGGYAAGYYSYLWAEVLSADCYLAFTETIDGEIRSMRHEKRSKIGQRFLQEILALGSVRPAIEHFKAFMNREPRLDALLTLYGLSGTEHIGASHAA